MAYKDNTGMDHATEQDAYNQTYANQHFYNKDSGSSSSTPSGSEWKPTDLNAGITAADRAFDDARMRERVEKRVREQERPFIELRDKYNSSWELKEAKNFKESGHSFAIVVNTLRDPKTKNYFDEIIKVYYPEALPFIEQLNKETPKLCFEAGFGYAQYASEMDDKGDIGEALKYQFLAITYYSYFGTGDLLDVNIQVLATMYMKCGNICKSTGKTGEANDYYQRAANIANTSNLEYMRGRGISFNVSLDTVNNDAEARYKEKNYPLAEYLWQKALSMGDTSAKKKIEKMQKEAEAEYATTTPQQTVFAAQTGLKLLSDQYYFDAAAGCFTNHDWDGAISNADKAISLAQSDEDGSSYYIRAMAYIQKGDQTLAITDFKISADYGNTRSLGKLKELGIDYTPKQRSTPEPQQQSSPKFCKQCGKPLKEGAKFCGGCGAKLG
jgi:hypothetical protein